MSGPYNLGRPVPAWIREPGSGSGNFSPGNQRIGKPTRDKWLAFLSRCLELEYLTLDEYITRMEIVQSAKVYADYSPAIQDLPWQEWSRAWDDDRERGLHPKAEVLPDRPASGTRISGATWLITSLLIIVFVFAVVMITVT